jgi:hypothetical protein
MAVSSATVGDSCAQTHRHARKLNSVVNKTGAAELGQNKQERDFVCVVRDAFRVFAQRSSAMLGSAWAFTGAVLVILVWLLTGPMFHFSDTWQLIINQPRQSLPFSWCF